MSRLLNSYRKAEQARGRTLAGASGDALVVVQRAEQRRIENTAQEAAAKAERSRPYENIMVLAASAEPVRRKEREPDDAPRSNFAALTTIGRHGESGEFETTPHRAKSRSRRAYRWLVALLLISIAAAGGYFAYGSLSISPPAESGALRVNEDTTPTPRQPEAAPATSPPRVDDTKAGHLGTSPGDIAPHDTGALPEDSEDGATETRQEALIVKSRGKTANPAIPLPNEARPVRPVPDTRRPSTRPGFPVSAPPVAGGSGTPSPAARVATRASAGTGNTGPSTPVPPVRPNATDALRALGLPVPSRAATTTPASTDRTPANTRTPGSNTARDALSKILPPAPDDGPINAAANTGLALVDGGTTATDTPTTVPVSASDVLSGIFQRVEDDSAIDDPASQVAPIAGDAGPSVPGSSAAADLLPGINPLAQDDGPTNTAAGTRGPPTDDGATPTDSPTTVPVSASDLLSDLIPSMQNEGPADTMGGTNGSPAGNGAAPGDPSPSTPISADDLLTGTSAPTQSNEATVTNTGQEDPLPEIDQAPTPAAAPDPAQDTSSPDTEIGGTTPAPTQSAGDGSSDLTPDATGPPPVGIDVPVVVDSTPGGTGTGSAGDPAPTVSQPVVTQGTAYDTDASSPNESGAPEYETNPYFQPYDGPPPNPIPESAAPAPMAATDTSIDIHVSLDDVYIIPNPLAYLLAVTDTSTRASADEGEAVISAHFADAQASGMIEPYTLLVNGGAVDYNRRIATIELDHLTRAEALTENPLGASAKADTLVGFDGVIAVPGADAALELEWDVDRLVVHSEATNALSVVHHVARVWQRPADGNAVEELVSLVGFSVLSQNGEQLITTHELPGSTAMRDWLDRMNNGNAASQLLAGPSVQIPLTDQFIDSQTGLPVVEISLGVSHYEYAVESPVSAVQRVAEQAGSVGNQGGVRWNATTQILEFDPIPVNVLSDNAARVIADHYLHDPLVGAHLEIDPLVYAGALGDDRYFTGNEVRLVGADGNVLFWAALPSVRFDDRLVGDQGFNLFSSLLNFAFEDGDGTTWLDQFGERFQQADLYMPELFIGLDIPESLGDDWLSTTFETAVDALLSFASSPAVSDQHGHVSEIPIVEPTAHEQAVQYDPVLASNVAGDEWFSPGNSPGTAVIDGDYALDGGTLLFEILGTEAGLEYDQLIVNGNVDLNEGNVVVAFIDSFIPMGSDLFDLILADHINLGDSVDLYYGFFDPADNPLWTLHAPTNLNMYAHWDISSGITLGTSGQTDQTGERFAVGYATSTDVAFLGRQGLRPGSMDVASLGRQGLQAGPDVAIRPFVIGTQVPAPAPLLLIAAGGLLAGTFRRKT